MAVVRVVYRHGHENQEQKSNWSRPYKHKRLVNLLQEKLLASEWKYDENGWVAFVTMPNAALGRVTLLGRLDRMQRCCRIRVFAEGTISGASRSRRCTFAG